MADPARRNNQLSSYVSVSFGGSPMPDPHLMDLREEIRLALTETAGMITSRRGISGPLRTITVRVPGAPAMVRKEPTGNREALAVFIAKHAEWIGGQPDAVAVVQRLHNLARIGGEAWRAAHPSGPTRLYVGECPYLLSAEGEPDEPCGGRLYQIPEEPLITCSNCGASDTIEQFERWMFPDGGETAVVDAYAAARTLSRSWFRPVDPGLIRLWAFRARTQGRELADMEVDPTDPTGERQRPRRDGTRVVYRLQALRQEAQRLWGDPPKVTRRA